MASQKMLEEYYRCHGMGDRKLAVLITLYGDIHCFPEAMSVYRYVTTSGTSWSARVRGKNISLVLTNYYLDIMDFAEKWFSRDLWMEPALFVTMLASILHIVRKRDRTDIDITRRILCNFRFWKRIMCRIYAHPFMMVKRTYTYIFLPKNSTVGYRPKRHHK